MPTDYLAYKEELERRGGDPSLLCLCRASPLLLSETSVGRQLREIYGNQKFPSSFLREVKKDKSLSRMDAFKPSFSCFAPHKREACQGLLRKMSNPSTPFQPVLIQTAVGNGNFHGAFCAFQSARDAMIFLSEVQEHGFVQCGGQLINAATFFEVPFIENNTDVISSMVLDYEIMHGAYKDDKGQFRKSLQEVMDIAGRFPEVLYRLMIEAKLVEPTEKIQIVVKNKCRPILNKEGVKVDDKVSFHFTIEVYGRPSYEHRLACLRMFGKYMGAIEEFHQNKNQIPLSFDTSAEYLPLDPRTWNGKQPISTLGSVKKSGDPPCFLEYIQLFQNGREIQKKELAAATGENRLEQLHASCFTVPRRRANYSEDFLKFCKREQQGSVNRTLTCHQTPCGGGAKIHPPFDGKKMEEKIPAWLRTSAKEPVSVNSSIPCLSTYITDLGKLISPSSPLVAHRVQNIVCLYQLFGYGEKKVHSSNGVFVIINTDTPDTIYAKCSSCTLPTTLKVEDTCVLSPGSPLRGWLKVDKDKFLQLLQTCTDKGMQRVNKKIKIKH